MPQAPISLHMFRHRRFARAARPSATITCSSERQRSRGRLVEKFWRAGLVNFSRGPKSCVALARNLRRYSLIGGEGEVLYAGGFPDSVRGLVPLNVEISNDLRDRGAVWTRLQSGPLLTSRYDPPVTIWVK